MACWRNNGDCQLNRRQMTGNSPGHKMPAGAIATWRHDTQTMSTLATERMWMRGNFPPTWGWHASPSYFW